jgi:type I restriction enzyme S subunit
MTLVPKFQWSYLFQYLAGFLRETVSKQKLGNTMPYIKLGMLTDFEIPLAPLSTQLDIVARLDSAMAEIADTPQLRLSPHLRILVNSGNRHSWVHFLVEGKEWEKKTFEEVCEISSKLIDPRNEQYQWLLHVWWANIESITWKLIDLRTAKEEKLISGKFLFDESIVLYSKIRPYLIKVARPDFEGLCSADIYPLSPKKNILHKDFLYYLLISKDFTEYAIKWSARAGMPKVNREHLFAYSFHLPPLSEQSRILAHLDAVRAETDRLETLYTEKLASLDELRKSVLQEAFL